MHLSTRNTLPIQNVSQFCLISRKDLVAILDKQMVHVCTVNGQLMYSFGRDHLQFPTHIASFAQTGSIVVMDQYNKRIQVFSTQGHLQSAFNIASCCASGVNALTVDNNSESIVLLANDSKVVVVSSTSGEVERMLNLSQSLVKPKAITVYNGLYYIADAFDIKVFSAAGSLIHTIGNQKLQPCGLHIDDNGEQVLVMQDNGRIAMFDRVSGGLLDEYHVTPASSPKVAVMSAEGYFLTKVGDNVRVLYAF